MSIIKKSLQVLSLFALPICTAFAINPISWTLTQNFPDVVLGPGGTYVASYTFVNQLPFSMATPFNIQKTSSSASEFSYDDLCSGKKLAHLESCTVTIYLNPTFAGKKTVQLTEVYGNNQVPVPMLSASASGSSGGTSISGEITAALPAEMNVSASAPWSFTFTNNGIASATGINIVVTGSSYTTTCGLSLSNESPDNTCVVQGTFTASSTGAQTVSATLSYAQGAPVAESTSTSVSGASSGLVCTTAVPLAPETLISSSTPVTLLCTNKSGDSLTIDGHTAIYPIGGVGSDGTFTPGSGGDNCTASSILPNGASCQLNGAYDAPSSPHAGVTISLLVNYHTPTTSSLSSSTSTSTDVVSTINNSRIFHLVNNCNFTVWWSMVGGAVTNSPACTSDSDCNAGAKCNVSAKLCYYNNYGPTSDAYQLAANGGGATTQIIETAASTLSDSTLWKGLISASTQCSGTSCLNNDCQNNGGTTSCAPGVGFQQPATEAEFTLLLTGSGKVDSYDISNVNGFSMPISMATNVAASDYVCGTAGNNLAAGNLSACNFNNVAPPTNMYYWVQNTNVACISNNTCADTSQICGLAFDTTANNYVKNCGAFLGFWAANQICQTNPSFSSPFGDNFSCTQVLANPPFPSNTYQLTQLLKCSPPVSDQPLFNSCYLSYSSTYSGQLNQCCGCTNWTGIAYPSTSCPVGQTNSQWTTYVEPLIEWMKKACPTSYAYPYDDKASSFQCTAASSTQYTITFCPGGGTGLPSGGITDGR